MKLYCGIDLHSTNSYVVVMDEDFQVVCKRRLRNDLGMILRYLEPYQERLVELAVESTFNWYWLVDGLRDAGYRVRLVNTQKAVKFSDLKYRDDEHDAAWIAKMLVLGILPEGYAPNQEERRVRDLLRRRGYLVRKRTSFLLSLGTLVQRETGQRLDAPLLSNLTRSDVRNLVRDEIVAENISSMLGPIRCLREEIKNLEARALELSQPRQEFELLMTTAGIGKVIALTIMHETIDINRFPSASNYVSYCRCAKTVHTTDGKRKGEGNRKNGNKYLSWAYSEAAHHCRTHEPLACRYYQRKCSRSHPQVAKRALAAKLARGCYYVLRDQVPFDPTRTFV